MILLTSVPRLLTRGSTVEAGELIFVLHVWLRLLLLLSPGLLC